MVHGELEMKWFMLSAAEMGSRVLIKNSAVVQRRNPKPDCFRFKSWLYHLYTVRPLSSYLAFQCFHL